MINKQSFCRHKYVLLFIRILSSILNKQLMDNKKKSSGQRHFGRSGKSSQGQRMNSNTQINELTTLIKISPSLSQNSQDQREKQEHLHVEGQKEINTHPAKRKQLVESTQQSQRKRAQMDEKSFAKQEFEKHKIKTQQQMNKMKVENDRLKKLNYKYNSGVFKIRELISSHFGEFIQQNEDHQFQNINKQNSLDDFLKILEQDINVIHSKIKKIIEFSQCQSSNNKEKLQQLKKQMTTQVSSNKIYLENLKTKYQKEKSDKIKMEAQKKKLDQRLAQLQNQKTNFQTKYNSKASQYEELNKKYQQQIKNQTNLTEKFQKISCKLKQQYQEQQAKLKNLYKQKQSKLSEEHHHQQLKYQDQKKSVERQLRQTIAEKQQKIREITSQKQKIINDWKIKYSNVSERQKDHQQQFKNFEQNALKNLNDLIFVASKSSQQRNQSYCKTIQSLQTNLKEQIKKGEEYVNYIIELEEQITKLTNEKVKNFLDLQAKNTEIIDCKCKIEELTECIKDLKQRESRLKEQVHAELLKIKKELESKLKASLEESSSFYEKLLKQNNQKSSMIQQRSAVQLELAVKVKDLKLECLRQNEQKKSQYISTLQRQINQLNRRAANQIQQKDLQIEHLNDQLKSLEDKLRLSQQHKDLQEKNTQKIYKELVLLKKTLIHIHSQLQHKKLIEIIKDMDGKEGQYHGGLLDLANGICHSQNQLSNRAELLEITLNKIKSQKGSLLSKLNSSEKVLAERLQQTERQKRGLQVLVKQITQEIAKINQENKILKEQIEIMNQQLLSVKREKETMISMKSQTSKKDQFELNRAKAKISELEKDLLTNRNMYERNIKQLQNNIAEEKKKAEQSSPRKNDTYSLQLKIKELNRQNDKLRIQNKQLQSSQKILEQKKADQKDQTIKNLALEISVLQSNLSQMKSKLSKSEQQRQQLKKKLKAREQQLINRRSNTLVTRDSEKSALSEQNKQLQTKVENLQAELNELKKSNKSNQQLINKLKDQLKEQKQLGATNTLNRKISFNQEEGLIEQYEKIIQSVRQENQLLEEQITNLKAKVKRLQNQKEFPKKFISPPKSCIIEARSLQRPGNHPTNINQKQAIQSKILPKQPKLFSVSCLLDDNEKARSLLSKTIQNIYCNKKTIETKLLYKYTEASKTFSFNTLLSKVELPNECYLFLYSTQSSTFGVLSYKKDAFSKQSALLFSADNLKLVFKKADSSISNPVTIDYVGDLIIANGHLKMKSSQRVLIVKQPSKYFDFYEKKEIFGKEYWRDQMNIDINEFQIHKIYFKDEK